MRNEELTKEDWIALLRWFGSDGIDHRVTMGGE